MELEFERVYSLCYAGDALFGALQACNSIDAIKVYYISGTLKIVVLSVLLSVYQLQWIVTEVVLEYQYINKCESR